MNAYKTGQYRNVFGELGIPQQEIDAKLEQVFQTFFYGSEAERIYHPVEPDMGYLEDTGNHDARTEGMSYGMMYCVQLDKKEEFDRIWKWTKTNMFLETGYNEGYFAWSCPLDGRNKADGPAPDGEEFFAMALFFASHRWGDGEGIFNYSREAKEILHAAIRKGLDGRQGVPMWNRDNHLILFVPGIDFSDPSYHLPHFYELFAQWAYEEDREFFRIAAEESRKYLIRACHPVTGLNAEYAEFDGTPMSRKDYEWITDRHDWFFSDSYRTVANIALDYEWFGKDEGQLAAVMKQQAFLAKEAEKGQFGIYEIDGTMVAPLALHPVGIVATTAQGILALDDSAKEEDKKIALDWVKRFWETPLRTGERRYYDNCLYFFAMLALSGNYRIW